jgi:hypothetical protein
MLNQSVNQIALSHRHAAVNMQRCTFFRQASDTSFADALSSACSDRSSAR